MIRYLTVVEVLNLHRQVIEQSGGALDIRDLGRLESAVAQPKMTFNRFVVYEICIRSLEIRNHAGEKI